MDPILRITQLEFAHGKRHALQDVTIEVRAGEVVIVLGPSGCGKTTLLRLIAGLERPSAGTVDLSGERLSGPGTFVPPEQRAVGMVFQGLALFPHLTVEGNIGFGLAHLPKAERRARVHEEMRSVGLEGLGDRYPDQLSGGQQQRVAIARSLVLRPKLMLMDEPFSDLDRGTRNSVRSEVGRILNEHGTAAIIVSHDREDAYHLGDRVIMMDAGKVIRIAAADDVRSEWQKAPFDP